MTYLEPPMITLIPMVYLMMTVLLVGRVKDFFRKLFSARQRKGYAPLMDATDAFYKRHAYGRVRDCWSRPIASAPDAWIDVMERTPIEHTSGGKQLECTGSTRRCLNLGSYNYLGFAAPDSTSPKVLESLAELQVSTCSSRADAGSTPLHEELESMVANFVGKEAAITFGMGFATNAATIPILVGPGCLILSDALNHSSIVAGARTSGALVKVFEHNNTYHLESLLRMNIARGQPGTRERWKKILIIVEGIYSMEGDVCLLKDIVAVKKKYGAYLFLDEAHSIGAMGKTGRGCVEHWGVNPADVDIMMGTFTKSFGSCGGYIAGSQDLIGHIRRNSPAHLYATAMSPASVQQVISAMKMIACSERNGVGHDKVRRLQDNANFFRSRLQAMGLQILGNRDSPVMALMIYHHGKLAAFSRYCLERHVAVVVVGYPATTLMSTRARVCISAAHSREDLEYALEVIEAAADHCMLRYQASKELWVPRSGFKITQAVSKDHNLKLLLRSPIKVLQTRLRD